MIQLQPSFMKFQFLFLFTLFLLSLFSLSPIYGLEKADLIYAYRDYRDPRPEKMLLVGSIRNRSRSPLPQKKREKASHFSYNTQPQQVIVQLSERSGIRVGQKLYAIEKHSFHQKFRDGLIVGEMEVRSLYQSPLYGWTVTAVGLLQNVHRGHYVARSIKSEAVEEARLLKRRGDHHAARADLEGAIAIYYRAQSLDQEMPELYVALGDAYYRLQKASGSLPLHSLEQYRRAWQRRRNFYYRYDELQYYQKYMQVLYEAYSLRRFEAARDSTIVRYLDRIIEVGRSARKLAPAAPQLLLGLARAHYYRMNYYRSVRGATARRLYDQSQKRAGIALKKSLEQGDKSRELYRLAILYYGALYENLRSDLSEDRSQRESIRRLIGKQLVPYYSTYSGGREGERDSEVDREVDREVNRIINLLR